MVIFIIIFIWLLCGFIGFGLFNAYFTRNWPTLEYEERVKYTWQLFWVTLCGLTSLSAALYVTLLVSGKFYGFKFDNKWESTKNEF